MRLATLGISAALTGAVALATSCGEESAPRSNGAEAASGGQVAAAARAGRAACQKVSARRLGRNFLRQARREASPAERVFVRNVERSHVRLRREPTYPQVVARLYAMSLPHADRRDGYLGCAHQLQTSSSSKSAAVSGGR
jgi:hypothetical protein